ncbi:VanW family protein [Patescibacteria group bacterium]|nr:VanW family protein [Patescibacteria group bacterium]
MNKPKYRSNIRNFFASIFFFIKKNAYWTFSSQKFSKELRKENLGQEIYRHQSLLLRPLKDVGVWMQYNKIQNLKLAIEKIDGLILKPGEVFSYWLLIGNPTKAKGYLPGMILFRGGFKSGIGGGLCQLSNLIYWMTLHTPLTVIERWRHSYDVFPDANRTQPFGSGATCSYPNIDLQIKNDTNKTFQLRLSLTSTHLVGQWFCDTLLDVRYEIEERNHSIQHEWWGGYTRNNELRRMSYDINTNEKTGEEMITENHAIMMYNPLLEGQTTPKEFHEK